MKTELREPNLDPFDPRQYIHSSRMRAKAPDWYDDINWSAFHDDPLHPAILKGVKFTFGVEAHTPSFAIFPALNKHNFRSPERSFIRASWEVDEAFHAYAAYAVLKAADVTLPSIEVMRHDEVKKNERLGFIRRPIMAMALSNLLPARAASGAINAMGVINEDTTGNLGYKLLGELSGHAEYKKLNRHVSTEEAIHGKGYADYTKEDVAGHPVEQRVMRKIVDSVWTMVGGGYMPEEECVGMVRLVAEHPKFEDTVLQVDKRTQRLPGMVGATLLQGYVEPRLAA